MRLFRSLVSWITPLLFTVVMVVPLAAQARTAVIVGDSQAQGLDGPLAASLAAYDVSVAGTAVHEGYTTNRVITELNVRSLVSSRNPDLIIVIAGGNDTVGTSAAQRSSYEGILSNALVAMGGTANYSKIVWIGPAFSRDAGVQARHDRTSSAQQAFFSRVGVRWIDGRTGSRAGPYQQDSSPGTTEGQIRNRNTHLTNAGYRRWACELAPQIVNQPASGSCPTAGAEADIAFSDIPGDVTGDVPGSDESYSTTCDPEAAIPVPITLGVSIGGVNQVSGLPEYINAAYRYMVSVILVIAIVMMVYGGFLYLVGSAGVGSIQRGKQIIKDAIVGMVIVLAAFAILQTINVRTTQFSLNPEKIECIAIPPESREGADEGGANIPACVKDSQCREGRVCLRTSPTEGISSGQCSQGRANELCRCSGGCDVRTSEDGSPTNNNGTMQVACTEGTCTEIEGLWRCLTGSDGSVCNMASDPPIPCAAGNTCQQGNQEQVGRCVAGDYRDYTLTPRPVCSSLFYANGEEYYRESNIISNWEGGCNRVTSSGVDSFCMSHRYRCSASAANLNECTEEEFASTFRNTGLAYDWNFENAPANLRPYNYARFGCRKPIGASCASDTECSSMCIGGTCSGFCAMYPDSPTRRTAGVPVLRSALDMTCSDGCAGGEWSPVHFAINFSGTYGGATIDPLDEIAPVTIEKAACYPKRPTGSNCDYNNQCTAGTCRLDAAAVAAASSLFPSFDRPLDTTAGIGVCE